MALQRSRSGFRQGTDHDTHQKASSRRKYYLRNFAKKVLFEGPVDTRALHVADASSLASRPVLVPLHLNLRRTTSRPSLMGPTRSRHTAVKETVSAGTGSKRKRHGSANENSYVQSRGSRAPGRFKRQRSQNDSGSDMSFPQSTMDVDQTDEDSQNYSSELSDPDENLLDDSDDFLIHTADHKQLNRLRKDELARLHSLAGLEAEIDELTKAELIDAIISSRIDEEEVPPSSPPGKTDGGSSSDDGHDGGGEETDAFQRPFKTSLRRRMTVQELGRGSQRAVTMERTLSLGATDRVLELNRKTARIAAGVKSPAHLDVRGSLRKRRSQSGLSSPITPSTSYSLPSPPNTRLRSRTISTESQGSSQASSSRGQSSTGTRSTKRSTRSNRQDSSAKLADTREMDDSPEPSISNPSPRRLRSNGSIHEERLSTEAQKTRVTPMRKAKRRIGSLKEDSTASESDEEAGGGVSDNEVDELDSSPSPVQSGSRRTQAKSQHTPLKRRLRSRTLQTHTPPSDGNDDNDEEGEDADGEGEDGEGEEDDSTDVGSEDTESVDGEGAEDDEEEGDETVTEPRVLRNGKVVGEDIADEEDSDEMANEDVDEAENASSSEMDTDQDAEVEEAEAADDDSEDLDEEQDEEMEDEFDLSSATKKSLVRLRRDDLVKLCEARELDVEGTKPQLAFALLEWRDNQDNVPSSPSSAATARPHSVTRANGRRRRTRSKSKSSSVTPPVLMRSHRIHEDEPVTPPFSKDKKEDNELELDLESLGLEDREIPPDKLTKLEKIGSGGFKDVFIGKFRGRKVAIAEFRDQLSAMDIKELKLLAEFQHANIVRFLGVSIPENTRETPVMIISELCTNGDLFDYVRNVPPVSLYKALNMMLDIARGLQYLHERKPSVIHRDCKSSNILITSKGLAKIADFGLAKVKQSTRSMVKSLVGTVNWQAPELWVAHPKYNHKVDVFSAACVYWEILQWHARDIKYPWEGMNEHAIYEAVGQKRQRPSLSGLRKQWCPEIVELIDQMWAQDPNDRPTIAEVVEEIQGIIKQYR